MNTDLAAQKALDRLEKDGFDALTETDKTLATVWLFVAGVQNGGFAAYFASHRGNVAFYAPAALRAIGAKQLAEIASDANAVFGHADPPRDYSTRRALALAFDEATRRALDSADTRFYACSEDCDELLELLLTRDNQPSAKEI